MRVACSPSRGEMYRLLFGGKGCVWRNDVDPVTLNPFAIDRLGDGHGGHPPKNLAELTRMRRIEVHDHNKRHARGWREAPQELRRGLKTTGRRADTYDEELGVVGQALRRVNVRQRTLDGRA